MVTEIIELIKAHKKQIIHLSLLVILLCVLVSIFTRYSLINISITNQSVTAESTIYTSSGSEAKELGKPGLHIIPRDTKSIIAQAGRNMRTQSQISIPWYGYVAKEVDVRIDKNADKIAYRSSVDHPCGTYSDRLNRMLQYDCSNANSLVYFNTPNKGEWAIEKTADMYYPNYTPIPYIGGLIGIDYAGGTDVGPPSNIISVSDAGEVAFLKNPEDIDIGKIAKAGIFADKHDQTNNRFVIAAIDGSIYLGTPKSKTDVDYVKIAPPKDYDAGTQQTLCNVNGDFITCYRGLSPNIGDGVVDFDSIKSTIIHLKFTDTSSETVEVDQMLTLDSMAMTNDGLIYGKSYKRLLFFDKKNTNYEVVELSQNIDGMAGGDKLTILQDDGVFTVDPTSRNLYQIFYSKNIRPKQLVSASGKVFVIGKVPGDKGSSYAWILNDENNTNNGNRLIDKLPSFPDSLEYGDTDFVGNVINIKVLTDRSSTIQGIRDAKQATLDYLESIGVDTGKLQLSN